MNEAKLRMCIYHLYLGLGLLLLRGLGDLLYLLGLEERVQGSNIASGDRQGEKCPCKHQQVLDDEST